MQSSDPSGNPSADAPGENGLPTTPTRLTEKIRLHLSKMSIESGVTLKQIVRCACESVAGALGIARVGAWVLVNNRSAIKCFQLYEADTGAWSSGAMLQVADFPGYLTAIEQRKVLPVESALTDPRTAELAEAYLQPLGITSLLDAPIYVAGEVLGVFCCEHTGTPREWSTEERDFVASIADLLAIKYRAVQIQRLRRDLESSEARLMAMEKSEALAKLALGVAHDFRNMLVTITNSVFLLKNVHRLPDEAREAVTLIEDAATAGGRLVAEMVDYGRDVPTRPQALNPVHEVDKFMPMLRTAVGQSHQIVVEHASVHGKIFLDRNQFDRVLLNLVLNARDASPPGSTIFVRTCVGPSPDEPVENERTAAAADKSSGLNSYESQSNASQSNEQTRSFDEAEKGPFEESQEVEGFVTVEVADSGIGMDEQTRQRVFDPYFSTKATGTGLGLAIVERIVRRAGGFIRVDSQPGCGTSIRVHLPRVSLSD